MIVYRSIFYYFFFAYISVRIDSGNRAEWGMVNVELASSLMFFRSTSLWCCPLGVGRGRDNLPVAFLSHLSSSIQLGMCVCVRVCLRVLV